MLNARVECVYPQVEDAYRTIQMSDFKETYERLRPLIVWLGLTELAWIAYWLLGLGEAAPGYVSTVVVWIAAMLSWMALAIYLGIRGVYLKHTRWLPVTAHQIEAF